MLADNPVLTLIGAEFSRYPWWSRANEARVAWSPGPGRNNLSLVRCDFCAIQR